MATKKATSKTTAITKWDEKFAGYAKQGKEQIKNIGVSGTSISFGRGKVTVGDKEYKGPIEVIIVGYCAMNAWYDGPYDPKEKTPPACYAFSQIFDDDEMAPHKAVLAANRQADKCAECEKNQFGSATTGPGKACGNRVRLGMLLASDVKDGETAAKCEMAVGSVSPTNLKRFRKYIDTLEEDHGRPSWGVVTEIESLDDDENQIRLEFKIVDKLEDDEIIEAVEKRFLKVQDALQTPYSAAVAKDKKKPSNVGKNSKFAGKGETKKPAGKR
jgi:hypothetical protein